MPTQVGIHDLLAATKKVVDADLRQHDDVANSGRSMVSSVGINRHDADFDVLARFLPGLSVLFYDRAP